MEEFVKLFANSVKSLQEQSTRSGVSTSVNIPTFDPSLDDHGADDWCAEIEKLAEMFGWSDYEMVARGATGLKGDAGEWFGGWKPTEKSWRSLREEMCAMYPPKRNLSEKFRKAALYTSEQADSYCEQRI